MNNIKRIAAVLMAVTMATTFLAGCGPAKTENQSSTGTSGESQTDSQAKTTHTLKILAPEPNHNKFTVFSDREEYPVFQKFQSMLDAEGLKLEYEIVAAEQYDVVLQTRMASANSLPDIVNASPLDNAMVLQMAKQGTVLPLNENIKKYSNGNIERMYSEVFPSAKALSLDPTGEMYWFSNLHKKITLDGKDAPIGLGLLLRKDWLDKLSLATPTTIDELTNVLTQFREKDANGNNAKDEILNIDISRFDNSIAQYFGLGNDTIAVDPINKKIVSPWLQPGIKEYFKYIKSLVDAKIVDPSLTGSVDLANQKTAENKVGGKSDYGMATWLVNELEGQGIEKPRFQPCMPLQAVEGIKPAALVEPADLTWNKYVITSACKDIEGAIKLFDVTYTDEYATLCAFGLEGENYTVNGNAKAMINNGSNEDMAKKKIASGNMLWRYVYPLVQTPDLESELALVPDDMQELVEFQKEIMTYDTWYPNGLANFLALPTSEETDEINKLLNGIKTYSQELATKLSIGQFSVDDWDKYTAEFDKLGLNRIIEIQQAQLDRFYAATK